ncbi:MAG: phosphoribosyltransferase [Spirochaetia bacterium]
MKFKDRREGGKRLAGHLSDYANRNDVIVLGLPRGGVPVADEVAKELKAPLDVFLVRKIGVPGQKELAMGAISSGGGRVLNSDIVESLNISQDDIRRVEEEEREELERREREFRGNRGELDVRNKTVILVDDGLATGASMRAAVTAVKNMSPKEVVVAVPSAARDSAESLEKEADRVIAVTTPEPYMAVGAWYENFGQTGDEEVKEILSGADRRS